MISRASQEWPNEMVIEIGEDPTLAAPISAFPVDFEDDSRFVREAQTMYYLQTGDFREFHELPTAVMKQLLKDAQALKNNARALQCEDDGEMARR